MIPSSHHGAWKGPNRLWLSDPANPERSEGTITAEASRLRYTWSFRGKPHEGELELGGPPGAVRGAWKDSFHMEKGTVLHGCFAEGRLVLYVTYSVGDSPEWGWRIEVDVRDPEHLALRMFNIEPTGTIQPAVDLHGSR
jgi:hypothetical protein